MGLKPLLLTYIIFCCPFSMESFENKTDFPITSEWICRRCFHDNPPGIPQCEICGRSYGKVAWTQ